MTVTVNDNVGNEVTADTHARRIASLHVLCRDLLVGADHYDIALRDLPLLLAALTLARLATGFGRAASSPSSASSSRA